VPQVDIVGIGPGGDERYLTDAARRAVSEADVVIFPGTQMGEPIRALVRGELRWGRWFEDIEIRAWVRVADQRIADVLEISTRHFGPRGRIVIGHRVGWPDEWVIDSTLSEFARRAEGTKVPKHTLLLVGPWHG
jgi:precorrin-4 methylase